MTESPELLEYVFKTIVAIGISVATFVLKDFRSTLSKLTENLQALTISVSTLVERDSSREHLISSQQRTINKLSEELRQVEQDVIRLETKLDTIRR